MRSVSRVWDQSSSDSCTVSLSRLAPAALTRTRPAPQVLDRGEPGLDRGPVGDVGWTAVALPPASAMDSTTLSAAPAEAP